MKMIKDKPYIDFTFTGVTTFTEVMDRALVSYRIYNDENVEKLFSIEPPIFSRDDDTIQIGNCSRERKTLFYAEFGMIISENIRSYIVFMFDHHPDIDELIICANDIEPLTVDHLKKVHGEDMDEQYKTH